MSGHACFLVTVRKPANWKLSAGAALATLLLLCMQRDTFSRGYQTALDDVAALHDEAAAILDEARA